MLSGPTVFNLDEDSTAQRYVTLEDADGDPVELVVTVEPTHGALSQSMLGALQITYTPDPDYAGPDTFSLAAFDGIDEGVPVVCTVNVNAVEDAPRPQPDTLNVAEAGSAAVNVLSNDLEVDGDALALVGGPAAIVVQPAHGTVQVQGGGNITYTHNGDGASTDTFRYAVTDGALTAEQDVTVQIAQVDDPPQITLTASNQSSSRGYVRFALLFVDEEATPGDVTVEYSVNNGTTWQPTTNREPAGSVPSAAAPQSMIAAIAVADDTATNIRLRASVAGYPTVTSTTAQFAFRNRTVITVDATPSGSWPGAATNLHTTLLPIDPTTTALDEVEVWVAAGTYVPNDAGVAGRDGTFVVRGGVHLYGGFAGGEAHRYGRDVEANPTLLSGERGAFAADDNVYHVVTVLTASGLSAATLSGLWVFAGYAGGGGDANSGRGGGLRAAIGTLEIDRCRFEANSAQNGANAYIDAGTLRVSQSSFSHGEASAGAGGAVLRAATLVFVQNFVTTNEGGNIGALDVQANTITFAFNTIYGNTVRLTMGTRAHQMMLAGYNAAPSGTFTGNVMYQPWFDSPANVPHVVATVAVPNVTFRENDMQGTGGSGAWTGPGVDGGGNLDVNPGYYSAASPTPPAGSPLFEQVEASLLPTDVLDLDEDSNVSEALMIDYLGNPRVQGLVDIGCTEQ